MKKLQFLLILLCSIIYAQAQSYFTNVSYNKTKQPGLALVLPYNTDVAEGTILKKLQEIGYKPQTKGQLFWKKNTVNGFYIFKGINLPSLNNQTTDLYFNVDQQGRKSANQSIMYMMVSKGYDNFISPDADSATFGAAKRFLNSFVSETEAYKLNQDIDLQTGAVRNAENKLKQLQDDETTLRKKLDQNATDQANQKQELESQRAKLQAMKDKVITTTTTNQ